MDWEMVLIPKRYVKFNNNKMIVIQTTTFKDWIVGFKFKNTYFYFVSLPNHT